MTNEKLGLKPYRVWANFKDSQSDIAVLVDAANVSDAERQGKELLKDERPFGGSMDERPLHYTVEQLF